MIPPYLPVRASSVWTIRNPIQLRSIPPTRLSGYRNGEWKTQQEDPDKPSVRSSLRPPSRSAENTASVWAQNNTPLKSTADEPHWWTCSLLCHLIGSLGCQSPYSPGIRITCCSVATRTFDIKNTTLETTKIVFYHLNCFHFNLWVRPGQQKHRFLRKYCAFVF